VTLWQYQRKPVKLASRSGDLKMAAEYGNEKLPYHTVKQRIGASSFQA